ncbi:TPA: MFS transporter [Streptococcus suis]|uniref:Major Facilitator Superfamily protein n=2 Tax=Streptococcus suis TaxID=1307 RepID=A0A0H3MU69_STRS4|nr:MFS transporter [Streptococcus suis]ADV70351.1 Major Facilitator Superfamily protein [Streptococcus suis JS14]AER15395.1 Major Facilitator Superfamily protein [Streptococcus suis SS12]AER44484.1 Major Facilitator Superfamily protein [Streptococcus suis A7]AGG64683.1 putative transporter YycB [Streptococcus suis SC070731]AKG40598.1 MFS transporter [Streptococcus suis]
MKKQSPFIIAGIVMLGVVMRAPFTALPAILIDVAAGLRVEVSSLGILTSIPLIMFALCSSLAPRLAAKFGMEKLMALVLLVMVLGSGMRVLNLPALYIGTMLVGATIAFINVLLPSLVAANFPKKIGLYTTIYITLMGVAATVASMIAVPIVSSSSWEFFILLITGLVFMAFLIWLPNVKNNHRFASENQGNQKSSIWKNKAAIAFLIFGGLQSVLYYTEITWLPTISQSVGFSKAEAGLMAGFFNMTAIPMSMIIPAVLSRQTKEMRRNIMLAISSVTLLGLFMMSLIPTNLILWSALHIILSFSNAALFPYMMLSFTLKTSNSQATAQLSGMVQTGGYLIAAFGPGLLGYSYPIFGNWMPLILALAIVTLAMMWTIVLIEREDIIL